MAEIYLMASECVDFVGNCALSRLLATSNISEAAPTKLLAEMAEALKILRTNKS